MTTTDDVDARVAALAGAAPDAEIDLWRAVVRLPQWFFIDRGEPDRPRPYGVAFDAGPVICVYSSAERAQRAARDLGLAGESEPVPLMTVPMPAALDWIQSFAAAGVFGIALDHPQVGNYVPLPNLAFLRREM